MNAEEFEKIFMGKDIERTKYFHELIPSIQEKIKSQSILENIFEVRIEQQDEIVSLPKKSDVPAVCFQEDAKTIETCIKGDRVFPPFYWVSIIPKVSLAEIASRQIDITKRTTDMVSNYFSIDEWTKLKSLLDKSVELHKHKKIFGWLQKFIGIFIHGYFLNIIEKAINKINKQYKATYILIPRNLLANFQTLLYKYGSSSAVEDFKKGKLFNLDIIIIEDFLDSIYILPEEKIGSKIIKIPLTVLPADQFQFGKLSYGFLFAQMDSMVITKTDSIFKLSIK